MNEYLNSISLATCDLQDAENLLTVFMDQTDKIITDEDYPGALDMALLLTHRGELATLLRQIKGLLKTGREDIETAVRSISEEVA